MEAQDLKLIKAQLKSKQVGRGLKVLISSLLFVGFLTYRSVYEKSTTLCINDNYHNLTLKINRKLLESDGPGYEGNDNQLTAFGKFFIGIGQILMDVWIGVLASVWLFKTKNVRVMLAIGLFYSIRGIIFLNTVKLPFPDNFAWRSPGFVSATVPYDHTRDFFYSGHCGGLTVIACEIFKLGSKKAGMIVILSLAYMANMLLTTQDHYSIDIFAGIIFALWLYRLAIRLTQLFDRILSLPHKGWLYLTKRDSSGFASGKKSIVMGSDVVLEKQQENKSDQ